MSNIEHYILQPAKFRLDGGAMFGIIPWPMWSKVAPPDELNRIDLALRLWLIKDGQRIILTDTGIGDYHGEVFDERFDVRGDKNPLVKSLQSLGIEPEQVSDIVISHLHFDHVGGLNCIDKDGQSKPIFLNARLHLHKDHYQYALKPSSRDAGSFHTDFFLPVIEYYKNNNQIFWLEGDQGKILDYSNGESLNFMTSHGHTPHLVHAYDSHYIYLADIIPTSNHVHIPWVMAYDINPAVSTEDKKRILDFIEEKNLTIIFEHDPLYRSATVEKDAKNRIVTKEKQSAVDSLAYKI